MSRAAKSIEDNFDPRGTVFSEFTRLSIQHGATNLGQGFTTLPVEDFVKKALADSSLTDNVLLHQYARSEGHPRLVKVLQEFYREVLPDFTDAMTQCMVTVGATEAIYSVIRSIVDNPNDKVVMFSPHYDSYPASTILSGGKPVYLDLTSPKGSNSNASDWTVDWKVVDEIITEEDRNGKCKLLILTNPHSPTGKVWSREELMKLREIVLKHDLLVLSDDVYETLVYDAKVVKFASLPDMWSRTFTIGSLGKAFGVTGWKIGWVIAPQDLTRSVWLVHQWNPFAVATPLQEAAAICFEQAKENGFWNRQVERYKELRDALVENLKKVNLGVCIPDAGYFVLAKTDSLPDPRDEFQHLRGQQEDEFNVELKKMYLDEGKKDYRLAYWLTTSVNVGVIPLSPFYSSQDSKGLEEAGKWTRFAFCKTRDMIDEAGNRLTKRYKNGTWDVHGTRV